jgi:hypothetical protein
MDAEGEREVDALTQDLLRVACRYDDVFADSTGPDEIAKDIRQCVQELGRGMTEELLVMLEKYSIACALGRKDIPTKKALNALWFARAIDNHNNLGGALYSTTKEQHPSYRWLANALHPHAPDGEVASARRIITRQEDARDVSVGIGRACAAFPHLLSRLISLGEVIRTFRSWSRKIPEMQCKVPFWIGVWHACESLKWTSICASRKHARVRKLLG